MTDNEKNLLIKMLKMASEYFGYKICNDTPEEFFINWSIDERKRFVKEYHEWNGDPQEYREDWLHLPDFAIFSFLAHKLKIA